MANTLLDANQAAHHARTAGADRLDPGVLKRVRNHYLGAIAKGTTDNHNQPGALATEARTLIRRFARYEDMILRFATDLSAPFTNNVAERSVRPVKIQQRTSGGCRRTLKGLTDFAVVHSYLDTATKWGIDKLTVLQQLFTTEAWLPPALTPAEQLESAGINRHGEGDESALHRRVSAPRWPRVMRWRSVRAQRSVGRGACRPGY
jgi:transposase